MPSLHATDAKRVAAAIERVVAKGKTNAISLDTIKALIAASCKHYTALTKPVSTCRRCVRAAQLRRPKS